MIFTSRFGALAARPTFERIAEVDDLDRELRELNLEIDRKADLEAAGSHKAN